MGLTILIIYLIGGITHLLIASYCDWYGNDPDLFGFSIFWFLALPMVSVKIVSDKVKQIGKEHRAKKVQKEKFRIVEEEKAKQLLTEAEEEADRYLQEIQARR